MLVLLIKRILKVRRSDGFMWLKTGTGVQVMLRFCFRILKGCNVGFTDGLYL
jgi:hypothetical protein